MMMNYRADIDGLRAVAVLLVIFFHADFRFFEGGFIGVDVFFVISGFLITSLILLKLEDGTFQLVDFWERRIRRILPALVLVILASAAFSWGLLLPDQFQEFSLSVVATSLFASNFFFWNQGGGYFATPNGEQPLLHTWSLAVEEQFYLLFPIFLIVVWKLGKRSVFWILLCFFCVSLFVSQVGVLSFPSAAFYLAPTRAWELLAGSLASMILLHRPKYSAKIANPLGLVGLVLILGSALVYDSSTPFPGLFALPPVVGTVLVIIFGGDGSIISRVLGGRALAGIGLLSYSAYLWHQPVLAFARLSSERAVSFFTMVGLILGIFLLAFVTYVAVERPFRVKREKRNAPKTIAVGLAVSLAFAGIGWVGASYFDGFRYRFEPTISKLKYTSLSDRLDTDGRVCARVELPPQYGGLEACDYGDRSSPQVLIVYGDSHLESISFELDRQAILNSIRVLQISIPDCRVIFDITPKSASENLSNHYSICNSGFTQLQGLVTTQKTDVMVISRWTMQMYPAPGKVEALNFDNKVGGVEDNLPNQRNVAISPDGSSSIEWDAKANAMKKLLNGLADSAENLYVNYPIPEAGWDIFRENLHWDSSESNSPFLLSYPSATYYERHGPVIEVIDEVAWRKSNVRILRSDLVFCDDIILGSCVAQIGENALYLDDDHLSDKGARLLLDEFWRDWSFR